MKDFKDLCMEALVNGAANILNSLQKSTGRFIYGGPDGGWGTTNQDMIYPLALLYKSRHPKNPYYGDRRVLEATLLGGDCIRAFQYEDGRVEFLKPDGSRWGPTYMPWTMYHWLETYGLLKPELEGGRAEAWYKGLTLAVNGIRKELETAPVHNIPTWNGMSLYRAGQLFGREDLLETGRGMIYRAVEGQDSRGFWPEHKGPTTHYNLVYVHAIGLYYEFSQDGKVLDCLRRALDFHITFTYPDGTPVETIDGRVKYHLGASPLALAAFSLFPKGRRYVRFLLENMARRGQLSGCTPPFATAYLHIHSGKEENILQDSSSYSEDLGEVAMVRKVERWFSCLSAFTAEPTTNRWGMDRQNHFSIWHENAGLIIGGGNSKDQPEWSNFVVNEGGRQFYIAREGKIEKDKGGDALKLLYGNTNCTIRLQVKDDQEMLIEYLTKAPKENPVRYNLILHTTPGAKLKTAAGLETELSDEKVELSPKEIGGWISHGKWCLEVPEEANLSWPVLPFNPYKKDGTAPLSSAACLVWGTFNSPGRRTFKVKVADD